MKLTKRMNRRTWLAAYSKRYYATMRGRSFDLLNSARRRTTRKLGERLRRHFEKQLREGVCKLCHLPFGIKHDMRLSPSVDKINPGGGYTTTNTQLVHYECNRIKGEFPQALVQPMIKRLMRLVYGRISKAEARRLGKAFAATGGNKGKVEKATPKH